MNNEEREQQWTSLYEVLHQTLAPLGTPNAFGDGDYWLVDDDYGDTTQKVCVWCPAFLTPELIKLIQKALAEFKQWRVMMQLEVEVNGSIDSSNGFIIYSDRIEPHWVTEAPVFSELRKRLRL